MPRRWYCFELWRLTPEVLALPREERIRYVLEHLTASSDGPFPEGTLTGKAPMATTEVALVLLFFAVIMGGPIALGLVLTGALLWGTWGSLATVLAVSVALAYHPLPDPIPLTTHRLTISLYKYFSYRWLWVDDNREQADACAGWIGAGPPHGVVPLANILSMPALNAFTLRRFMGCSASVVLRTPFLRYMTMLGGATDVSAATVVRMTRKGICLGIVPDGIAGIFQQRGTPAAAGEEEERVALKTRKGLAKLSLREGIPMVPVYCLGNTAVFSSWYDQLGIMEWLSRRLRVSIFAFWGRFGLPLPFRANISMLIGSVMFPPKPVGDPPQEAVDRTHGLLLAGIEDCFNFHKAACGWGRHAIRFV